MTMNEVMEKKSPSDWAALGDAYDCTGLIGPLYGPVNKEAEWAMYSFERPAFALWNAIAAKLNERGWSDAEIQTWLQSKNPRWAMDGELGDLIEGVGALFASRISKSELPAS
jgi:hypothetical protein